MSAAGPRAPSAPSAPSAAPGREVRIAVRDREVRAVLHVPEVIPPSVVPAIVIAPGQGYHMELPLVRGLFDRIVAEGWAAARFDWSFHTCRREPSPGYTAEVEELQAVIDRLRDQAGVDRSHFYIAGKSLGAGMVLERAASDPSIRGVVLLTPPIHSPKPDYKPGVVRPRLEKLRQPSLIVVGERDPLCELGRLYSVLSGLERAPNLAVVGGDHSLRPATESDSAAANVSLALHHVIDWLKRQSTR